MKNRWCAGFERMTKEQKNSWFWKKISTRNMAKIFRAILKTGGGGRLSPMSGLVKRKFHFSFCSRWSFPKDSFTAIITWIFSLTIPGNPKKGNFKIENVPESLILMGVAVRAVGSVNLLRHKMSIMLWNLYLNILPYSRP